MTIHQHIGEELGVVHAERFVVEAELLGLEIDCCVFDRSPGCACSLPAFDAHIGRIDHAIGDGTPAEAVAVFGGVVNIRCRYCARGRLSLACSAGGVEFVELLGLQRWSVYKPAHQEQTQQQPAPLWCGHRDEV